MYWTQELATYLETAPMPATKTELIYFCINQNVPDEVILNLEGLEAGDKLYYSIKDIWPDYTSDFDVIVDDGDYF